MNDMHETKQWLTASECVCCVVVFLDSFFSILFLSLLLDDTRHTHASFLFHLLLAITTFVRSPPFPSFSFLPSHLPLSLSPSSSITNIINTVPTVPTYRPYLPSLPSLPTVPTYLPTVPTYLPSLSSLPTYRPYLVYLPSLTY